VSSGAQKARATAGFGVAKKEREYCHCGSRPVNRQLPRQTEIIAGARAGEAVEAGHLEWHEGGQGG
jgi:hypothetical protein